MADGRGAAGGLRLEPTHGARGVEPGAGDRGRAGRTAADRAAGRLAAPAGAARGGPGRGAPRGAVPRVQPAGGAAGGDRRLARSVPSPVGAAAGRPAHRSRTRQETTEDDDMTEHTRARTLVGTMRSLGETGTGAVRMEDRYDTDVDDLWSALTEPQRLARWIGQVEGDLRLGGTFQARFTSSWEGPGRVDVCEPPRRLLVIMERGLPVDSLPAYGAGWQAHVEDLAAHLAGQEPADWRTRWAELSPSY